MCIQSATCFAGHMWATARRFMVRATAFTLMHLPNISYLCAQMWVHHKASLARGWATNTAWYFQGTLTFFARGTTQ